MSLTPSSIYLYRNMHFVHFFIFFEIEFHFLSDIRHKPMIARDRACFIEKTHKTYSTMLFV